MLALPAGGAAAVGGPGPATLRDDVPATVSDIPRPGQRLLMSGTEEPNLFEYALSCVLQRHLDAAFRVEKPPVVRYRDPAKLVPPLVVLLSRVALQGEQAPGDAPERSRRDGTPMASQERKRCCC